MDSYKKGTTGKDAEILFSRSVKAGKRIYYFDVKCDRRGEAYLSVTESKRLQNDENEHPVFEKHKIFVYPEDFDKFSESMNDVLNFAKNFREKEMSDEGTLKENDSNELSPDKFKLDIDF